MSSSSSVDKGPKVKKSRKERENEWKQPATGTKKLGGVDYSNIEDRIVGDKRFERERAENLKTQEKPAAAISSTFDAFQRFIFMYVYMYIYVYT
jgi:hypothetical protein